MSDELPQGWASSSFMDVFDIQGGTQPPKSTFKYEPTNGYVRLLQIRDFGEKPVPTFIQKKLTLKTCQKDDVLIGRYGASIGRICTGMEGAYNVALAKVIMPEQFERRFVFHLLQSPLFQRPILDIERSAQDGFNKEDLAEIVLPVAPLNEQRRIVAKLEALLDKVDASQQRLAKIPVLLKRFRQSVLAAACSGRLTADWREDNPTDETDGAMDLPGSWKSVEFGELINNGPQNGLYKPASFYGDGTLIVRIDAFYDGAIAAWGELKRVRLTEKERSQFALRNDDILVNRVNSPKFLGKCALVRKLKESCVYESNMMRLRLDTSRTLPDYAILYLQSLPGLVELRKNAKHAVNQSSINQEDVKGAMFNLPPLPEQQEIVRRVEGLFALADQLEVRLAKAREQVDKLTPSLLARAFAGQLVPQDPNDEPAEKLLERIKANHEPKSHRDARK